MNFAPVKGKAISADEFNKRPEVTTDAPPNADYLKVDMTDPRLKRLIELYDDLRVLKEQMSAQSSAMRKAINEKQGKIDTLVAEIKSGQLNLLDNAE